MYPNNGGCDDSDADVSMQNPVPQLSILCEKGLSVQIKLCSWNHVMDLVALVTVDNMIIIHRLNWQRLWQTPSEDNRTVTAITWNPNGKSLVTGYLDGNYNVWDIEMGQSIYSSAKNNDFDQKNSRILFMIWKESSIGDDDDDDDISSTASEMFKKNDEIPSEFFDRVKIELPPLAPLRGVDSESGCIFSCSSSDPSALYEPEDDAYYRVSSTTLLEMSRPERINVLVIADVSGKLFFYIMGFQLIASIDLKKLFTKKYPDIHYTDLVILNAVFSKDLSKMKVILSTHKYDDNINNNNNNASDSSVLNNQKNEYHYNIEKKIETLNIENHGSILNSSDDKIYQIKINTAFFKTFHDPLLAISWQNILIRDLMFRISGIIDKFVLIWKEAISTYINNMKKFKFLIEGRDKQDMPKGNDQNKQKNQDKHNHPTLENNFSHILFQGKISSEMEIFLTHNFTFNQTRKIFKDLSEVWNVLFKIKDQHLQPTIERLVYRLEILDSYSKWTSLFGKIGLDQEKLVGVKVTAARLLEYCDKFGNIILSTKELYMNFLNWLLEQQKGLTDDNGSDERKKKYLYKEHLVEEYLQTDILDDKIISSICGESNAMENICFRNYVISEMKKIIISDMIHINNIIDCNNDRNDTNNYDGGDATDNNNNNNNNYNNYNNYNNINNNNYNKSNSNFSSNEKGNKFNSSEYKNLYYNESNIRLHSVKESLEKYYKHRTFGDSILAFILKGNIDKDVSSDNYISTFLSDFSYDNASERNNNNNNNNENRFSNFSSILALLKLQIEDLFEKVSSKVASDLAIFEKFLLVQLTSKNSNTGTINSNGIGNSCDCDQQQLPDVSEIFEKYTRLYEFQFIGDEYLTFMNNPYFWIIKEKYNFETNKNYRTNIDYSYCYEQDNFENFSLTNNGDGYNVSGGNYHVSGFEIDIENEYIIDYKIYKDLQIILLTKTDNIKKVGNIFKVSLEHCSYYNLNLNEIENGMLNYFEDVVMANPFTLTLSELTKKSRKMENLNVSRLWVSGPRGVGLTLCLPKRVVLLDFENDQEAEEEQES